MKRDIEKLGRFPGVELRIKPLSGAPAIRLETFISYQFDSSMLTPVDTFSFTFAAPDDTRVFSDYFREGDIAELYCNDQIVATGIIDSVDVEISAEAGEKITVSGRDLMGQLEDQDAVSLDSTMIFGSNMTPTAVFQKLATNTRIRGLRLQDAPETAKLFATEPQESKLSALSRYLEPLNCIAWMDPNGTMVIGKPNMAQPITGAIIVDRKNRRANCMNLKVSFGAATIANVIVPVWAGQEVVQERVGKQQRLENAAEGPARLLGLGHRLPKCIMVSNPQGNSPQDFSSVNAIRAGGANLLGAYAKREMARQNVREILAQATLPSHCDGDGNPLVVDRTYSINYGRAFAQSIELYLFQVQYKLDEGGQRTNLFFTKKGTIVSDVRVQ